MGPGECSEPEGAQLEAKLRLCMGWSGSRTQRMEHSRRNASIPEKEDWKQGSQGRNHLATEGFLEEVINK